MRKLIVVANLEGYLLSREDPVAQSKFLQQLESMTYWLDGWLSCALMNTYSSQIHFDFGSYSEEESLGQESDIEESRWAEMKRKFANYAISHSYPAHVTEKLNVCIQAILDRQGDKPIAKFRWLEGWLNATDDSDDDASELGSSNGTDLRFEYGDFTDHQRLERELDAAKQRQHARDVYMTETLKSTAKSMTAMAGQISELQSEKELSSHSLKCTKTYGRELEKLIKSIGHGEKLEIIKHNLGLGEAFDVANPESTLPPFHGNWNSHSLVTPISPKSEYNEVSTKVEKPIVKNIETGHRRKSEGQLTPNSEETRSLKVLPGSADADKAYIAAALPEETNVNMEVEKELLLLMTEYLVLADRERLAGSKIVDELMESAKNHTQQSAQIQNYRPAINPRFSSLYSKRFSVSSSMKRSPHLQVLHNRPISIARPVEPNRQHRLSHLGDISSLSANKQRQSHAMNARKTISMLLSPREGHFLSFLK
jgi:hypothetical protein